MDGELEGSLVPKTTWLGCSIQPVSSETEEAEPEAEAEIEAADEPEAEADPTEAQPAAEAEHTEEDKLLAHLQLNMITANNFIPSKVRQI